MKQIDRCQACEKANNSGETDQTQVVFEGQARQYAEHNGAPSSPRVLDDADKAYVDLTEPSVRELRLTGYFDLALLAWCIERSPIDAQTPKDRRRSERVIVAACRRCDASCRHKVSPRLLRESGRNAPMKAIGILACVSALLATTSIASAQSQNRSSRITYGDRYNTSPKLPEPLGTTGAALAQAMAAPTPGTASAA